MRSKLFTIGWMLALVVAGCSDGDDGLGSGGEEEEAGEVEVMVTRLMVSSTDVAPEDAEVTLTFSGGGTECNPRTGRTLADDGWEMTTGVAKGEKVEVETEFYLNGETETMDIGIKTVYGDSDTVTKTVKGVVFCKGKRTVVTGALFDGKGEGEGEGEGQGEEGGEDEDGKVEITLDDEWGDAIVVWF